MMKNTIGSVDIPKGYIEVPGNAAFATRNGPYFEKKIDENTIIRAFRPDERHLNGVNFVHGGMLMSFADSALARAINYRLNIRCVTLKMNSEFLAPVRAGDWVEAHMEVVRNTKSITFARGDLRVGKRIVFKTDALFHTIKADHHLKHQEK